MEQQVRRGEQRQHDHQGAEAVQPLGQPVVTQHAAPQVAAGRAQAEADHCGLGETQKRVRRRAVGEPQGDELVDQHRADGPDRIDQDAFPAQDLADVLPRA